MITFNKKTERESIYETIDHAIADCKLHIEKAVSFADEDHVDKSIVRCERAIGVVAEICVEIAKNDILISRQKMRYIDRNLADIQRSLWCATKKINGITKSRMSLQKRSKKLRLNFLAYSFEPASVEAEAVGV